MRDLQWWQKAVFYQIYPRSFADSNADGIGDIKGMIQKLDYLQSLGIEAIWLSPHYPSPQFDCGYDIADYTAVEPEYGDLEDFKVFLAGCHNRGIRLILDLVLNHTSHLHPWFVESRSSLTSPKRDWYIWRDGRKNGPPNNWISVFGGSTWELDPQTGQYYYHYFFKEQPDLNWRNPEVKQAVFDAVRFWLDLGVDGFRLDAIGTIFEHPDIPDHESPYSMLELRAKFQESKTDEERKLLRKYWMETFKYQVDQPGIHALFRELRQVIDEYPDRLMVAEDDDIAYMGNGTNEMHMVFNFPLMRTRRITPEHVRINQSDRLPELAKLNSPGWPCNTLGNHDAPRMFSHFGDGTHDRELARLNLALLLTMKGTPFLYNGEEIGMTDLILEDITQFRDLLGVWQYQMATGSLDLSSAEALRIASEGSRDKNRTPMQWENSPNAGFCPAEVKPWLLVNSNYAQGVNVADQEGDPQSLLNFYRRLIGLRQKSSALIQGDYEDISQGDEDYLAFLRRADSQTCLVVLNYSPQNMELDLGEFAESGMLLFSSTGRAGTAGRFSELAVAPYEVFIAEIQSK